MKLILTSKDFLNEKSKKAILDNLGNNIKNIKILFVPPAKATKEELYSNKYQKRVMEYGFSKENIYILNYLEPDKSRNLNIDAIYVGGGNTFLLLDRLRKCGFDKDIINYVKSGVIYIGGSAGTHIVTKNIKHVLNFDTNDVKMTNFKGLDLFDGIIICHYNKSREKILQSINSRYKIYTIKDDEYIIYVK